MPLKNEIYAAVLLIGGPDKGTRFRPLSLSLPKPLFPVAGKAILMHIIDQIIETQKFTDIILVGSYDNDDKLTRFLLKCSKLYKNIEFKYLKETTITGTGAALLLAKHVFQKTENVLVLNGDICGNFLIGRFIDESMKNSNQDCIASLLTKTGFEWSVTFHNTPPYFIIVGCHLSNNLNLIYCFLTKILKVADYQSQDFGCVVYQNDSNTIEHFVEKPSTFVSCEISTGCYVFSSGIVQILEDVMNKQKKEIEKTHIDCTKLRISLENNIFPRLVEQGLIKGVHTDEFWIPMKDPSSVLYGNAYYLSKIADRDYNHLNNVIILENVYIHDSVKIGNFSKIGPNVSIDENVTIGKGVRIKNSIILENVDIKNYSLISNSIIGWNCKIHEHCRIEGTESKVNPNVKDSIISISCLFTDGSLNPCTTVLGNSVSIIDGKMIKDSIVLPYKNLTRNHRHEIIL
ncbi:hypothetical protein A3Q56_01603 [Intoshia linei]|uniref:Nucleotidyl transferase domain-containing protein n=1 Tax=Intoshia linei TaxID=1819745 RepID=A0A177B8K6_9BILA|nr:hypothetical protein A3Q56_01603 [Intoshia linei]